jgi:hypothetical protein
MLAEFQRALADLTASPDLCREVRADPAALRPRYDVTEREWRRLVSIAQSKGMEANCMLYRANRLAPVALNLPRTCELLREELPGLLSRYWAGEPTTDVHFLVEADRFCRFLREHAVLPDAALAALAEEHAEVAARLEATRLVASGF